VNKGVLATPDLFHIVGKNSEINLYIVLGVCNTDSVVKQSGELEAVPQTSVSCSNQPKSPLASQPIHQR